MKKGLLSILAASLLVVGCQDYDDQFSSLESQISALASTVAGLSQVQSDLASLSGTVASLASTVNGLGDAIDTAVSDGLTDIQADIDAIETAVADVATSEEVSSLSDAVDAAQDDLTDLLANSSVFTGTVKINNQSTLDAFYNMGSGLAIVNGGVDIDVSATMDIAKVQSVVDNILTTTEDYDYKALSTDIGKVTFNKLSGTQSLTVEQAGAYMFKGLVSAGNIVLKDTYKTKVDTIHLGALTTVTSLSDGTTANTLDFSSAAELHLSSLTYYAGGNLTLNTKRDGVLDIGALTDTNSAAVVAPMTLTVDGPASLTISGMAGDTSGATKGAITLTNVGTASISNFGGTITLGTGVDNATLEDVAVSPVITAADDLVTLSIEGVTAYGKTWTTAGTTAQTAALETASFIDVALTTTQGSLTDVTITGKVDSFTSTNADNIQKMTLDNLTANVVNVTGAAEMTTITTGASKINDFTLNNNDDLTSVALDFDVYTTVVASTATADASGDINITGNKKLASLTVHVKSANDIDIDTNDALATINFPFLATVGGTNADIDIFDNALVATSVTDNYDADAAGAAITTNGTTNTGTYATSSNIGTLTAWIDAVITAGTTATLAVWFDTVSEVKVADVNGTITTTNPGEKDGAIYHVAANAATYYAAVYIVPGVTKVSTMDGAIAGETRSYVFELKRDGLGNVKALGALEGVTVKYGANAADIVSFVQNATTRTTVQSLVDYMNADTSLASANLNIDAAIDSNERYVYTVSYLTTSNSVNSAGRVSVAGSINALFGTKVDGTAQLLSTALVAGNGANEIAEGLRVAINNLAEYNATTSTDGAGGLSTFYVTRNVSGTATVDKSPLMAAAPTLDIVIDAAMTSTTAVLGGNTDGYKTVSHLSNTFAPSRFSIADVTPVLQSNLRITLRDTSGLGMSANVTMTAGQGGATVADSVSNTAITMPTGANAGYLLIPNLLQDGVSIVSASTNVSSGTTDTTATTYYVAGAAAGGTESVSTAAVTAITTDRTGWIPAGS